MELIGPLIALAVAAWCVPWLLGRILPEGVGWLLLNGAVSTAVLTAGAAAGFVFLYGAAGGVVWREAPGHFVWLSLRSALVWAPVAMLSLANLPRGWRRVKW